MRKRSRGVCGINEFRLRGVKWQLLSTASAAVLGGKKRQRCAHTPTWLCHSVCGVKRGALGSLSTSPSPPGALAGRTKGPGFPRKPRPPRQPARRQSFVHSRMIFFFFSEHMRCQEGNAVPAPSVEAEAAVIQVGGGGAACLS